MKNSATSVLKFIRIFIWFNLIISIVAIIKILHLVATISFFPEYIPLNDKSDLYKINQVNKELFYLIAFLYVIYNSILSLFLITSIKLCRRINLNEKFNARVLLILKKITKLSFYIALLDIIIFFVTEIIINNALSLNLTVTGSGFLLLSAILYIVTHIYQQGVDLKAENDLTI